MTLVRALLASPVILGWLAMGVRAIVPLLGAVYSAQTLSPEEAVIFWLALSIYSITGLLDFGFMPTFVRYLAYAVAPGAASTGPHSVSAVLSVQTRIYHLMTPSFFLITGVVLAILLISGAEAMEMGEVLIRLALILLGATATFHSAKARAILQGTGYVVVQKRIEAVAGLLNLTGFLFLFFEPLSTVLLLFAITRALELALLVKATRSLGYEGDNQEIKGKKALNKELVTAALRSGLGVLATGLVVEGTALMATQALEPPEAARYMMSLRFVIMLAAFAQLPFQVSIPSLVTRFSHGQRAELIPTIEHLRSLVLGVLAVGAIAFPLLLKLINLLGLDTVALEPELWGLLVLYAFMERGGAVNIQAQTLNKEVNWHKVNGLTGIACSFLVAVLGPHLGSKGFALAFVIAYGLVYLPYSIYLRAQVFKPMLQPWDWILAGCLLLVLLAIGVDGLFNYFAL